MTRKNKLFKYLILVFLCLCIGFTLSYCKKYPEDKFISLRKPEKRVVGNWKIKEYHFNGGSIINSLNNQLKTFDIRNLTLTVVSKSGKIPGYYFIDPFPDTGFTNNPLSDKTKFRFVFHNTYDGFQDSLQKLVFISPLQIKNVSFTNWEIRNLYGNKMHLQLKTDTGNYDIYFEK